jgi:hypothetical protein
MKHNLCGLAAQNDGVLCRFSGWPTLAMSPLLNSVRFKKEFP